MENKNSFLKVLEKVEYKIKKVQEQILAIRKWYQEEDVEKAYEAALYLEELSEQTVLLSRILPAYTGIPHAAIDVLNMMTLCIPVEIGFTAEGWFSLRIPVLLPKKEAGSVDYVRSFLYPAMRDFFKNKEPVRYRNCVLIYRHIYDRTRPERKKRDHDNIEVNMVSDIVAMYVMTDDGPEVCSHYYCSAEGIEERTEIYVLPQKEFPLWLMTEKTIPEKGVALYETRTIDTKKDM